MTKPSAHLDLPDVELLTGIASLRSAEQQLRVRQLQEHLHSCEECKGVVEAHKVLRGAQMPTANETDGDCPEHGVWLEIAAGIAREEDAARWIEHAKECSGCAAELEAAREDAGSDTLDPETQLLESSHDAWQQRMAAQLHSQSVAVASPPVAGHASATARARVLAFPRRRFWIGAIAAMLLVSAGAIVWRQVGANSEDSLLAAAYDAQRRTDLHLPNGDAVPLASLTRGSSLPSEPTELLRLRLRAQEHLEKDPNNAYWHLTLGRVALVENNGRGAREQLATASALDPSLPGLQSDLAAAYFEIGESSGDLLSYARAADLYGRVIDSAAGRKDKESLARAYFNRALCWERQAIFYEAAKDYREALKTEENPAWRHEIQERLDAVSKLSAKGETRPNGEGDHEPRSILEEKQAVASSEEDRYEFYLDAATREWLSRAASSPDAHSALLRLAAVGVAHHDMWVRDMLNAPSDRLNESATMHLSLAVNANSVGNADIGAREAQQAEAMFRQAANRAGMLRAEVEAIYSLQRQGNASDCLKLAGPLLRSQATEPYAWLHGHLLLEASACNDSTGNAEQPIAQDTEAIQRARHSGLPLQALRAEGFLVSVYDSLGQTQQAWDLAAQGLRECVGRNGTAMPTYQFLQSIHLALNTKGLHYTAAGMADAAAHASEAVTNLQVRAYAQELLGRDQTNIGHEELASQAFGSAAEYLNALPAGAATRLYHADWEADGSEWLSRRGQLHEAILRMKAATSAVSASDNFTVRRNHFTEFAKLLLMQHDADGAAQELAPALRDAEASLASTQGESQRLAWERNNGRAYRLLTESLEMKGEAETSLRAWEWYRAAAYRASRVQPGDTTAKMQTAFPVLDPQRLGALTLVLGRTEDGYMVWSVTPAGVVRMEHPAASGDAIVELADTFAELCSHRESSVPSLRIMGAKLYGMLFAPYQQQIESAGTIQLDVDPRLQMVPFAALTQPDGRYLGIAHGLVMLPAWWSVRPRHASPLPAFPRVLLVEGRQAGEADSSGATAILPQQYLETGELEEHFAGASVLRGRAASSEATLRLLTTADIFHYSGHTVARGAEPALLLGGRDDVLRPTDLAPLSLRHLSLATLAACSSVGGSSDVNPTGSLAHALLIAGAGTVVATLWDVDTQSSRELMTGFYSGIRQLSSPAEALQRSQSQLALAPETSHPYFWAAPEVFSN